MIDRSIHRLSGIRRMLLAAGLMAATGLAHAITYDVVDLGGTRFGVDTHIFGMNQRGVAVGDAGARDAPHLQHPVKSNAAGRATDLAVRDGLPGVRGSAMAINDRGQTAGWIESSFGEDAVAFIEQHGTISLMASPSGEFPSVRAINNRGDVAGDVWAIEDACFGHCAFVIHDGHWTILPSLPGQQLSNAFAINDSGLIVGESFLGSDERFPIQAVWWRDGAIRVLPGMERMFASAHDVNVHGDIVGKVHLPGTNLQHAFIWRQGVVTDLDDRADSDSIAWAVNAAGQVVGSRSIPGRSGFYVTVDGRMTWLDEALIAGPEGPWRLGGVSDLNDAGQIVGTARDPGGTWHAVRLDPID